MNNERLLTYKDVSELLQVTEGTLRQWVHKGKMPHIKIGRAVRFSREMIDEMLKEATREKSE